MRKSDFILFENKPAEKFTEAYPIGNGHIGAMLYGDFPKMKIGLNHDELWTGYEKSITHLWDKTKLDEAREAVFSGDYVLACDILGKHYAKNDASSYITLGDLYIDFGGGEPTDYKRTLDTSRGVAEIGFALNGGRVTATLFASYPTNTLVCRIRSDLPIFLSLSQDCPIEGTPSLKNGTLIYEGVCPLYRNREKEKELNRIVYEYGDRDRAIAFATVLHTVTDGEIFCEEGRISVRDGKETTLYFTVETSYKDGLARGKEPSSLLPVAEERVLRIAERTFDDLLLEHTEDFSELFFRSSVELDGKDMSDTPTSERVEAQDITDTSLLNLLYNFGKYLMISSSREGTCAANLQGIWCRSIAPPWGSGYTTNINTEMNYWAAMPTGLFDCMEPLEALVRVLNRTGKSVARDLFGARGACSCHNSDIFGHATPVSGMVMWSFFPCAYAWLVGELWRKYEYTGNEKYLESIYPLVEDAALFFIDTLVFDGKYYIFSPATSPENRYIHNDRLCQVAKSSTMFGSIAKEALANYINAADRFGIENADTLRANEIFNKLLPLRVMSDGKLDEWYLCEKDGEQSEHQPVHRHISHLYGLYPAREINTDVLRRAAKVSLDMRGDESTGWSLGWKMCCRARLFDGDACMRLIKLFLRPCNTETVAATGGGIYKNLFCAHPPFQIDGNFAFTAAISEMLVSERDGEIYPIPALPKELGNGRARGIRVSGNRAVDLSFKDGTVTEFKVYNL